MSTNKFLLFLFISFIFINCQNQQNLDFEKTAKILKDSLLVQSEDYLQQQPITVTSNSSDRSEGTAHDFYSEGDYWWPDPENSDAPYIQKDGMTNPENFVAHREALIRFSEIVGNLTSAYLITKDVKYAEVAIIHCKAWFVDSNTKMNPNLLYAQAIKGRHTGRGIGIIDAIHFIEVIQAMIVLEKHEKINPNDLVEIKKWFADFLTWLTTHKYGKDEMAHPNNHGTCWNMQVGIYAVFTKNDRILQFCRDNFKNNLLPKQMALDGSFPLEIKRTKPYGYALFNLDAMTMNCMILSDSENNLWEYETADGKSILKGLEYMRPFVADKKLWPLDPDVMYWENWPIAHPAYIFGSIQFNRTDFFDLWKKNQHFLKVFEVKRNVPIRNPLIWIE
jgi:hypothetical protein|tara:strand:+ start:1482 stop:2654 length:1173 start_codon:yes stop_codon:yes gene_type:complete